MNTRTNQVKVAGIWLALLIAVAQPCKAASTRWAHIVLDVVSEEQEKNAQLVFKVQGEFFGVRATNTTYQGVNLGALSQGKSPTIQDIIKKYGKPTRIGETKAHAENTSQKGKPVKETFKMQEYDFDGIISLEARTDNGTIQWLHAPTKWFLEGIRKKARQALH